MVSLPPSPSSTSSTSTQSSTATPPPQQHLTQQQHRPLQHPQPQQQIHSQPLTPQIATHRPEVLTLMQFNCNGLLSKITEDGVQIISYADDCSILATGNSIDDLCGLINSYLCDLSSFFHLRNLKISPTKSSATLFTTWTKEVGLELDVTVDGEKIPTVNHPKILGVTFDSLLMSSAHTTAICNKMRSRNKVINSLAGSTWGMDKETLLTTYQTIGRSVVNYAAPVWTPRVSDTKWKKLKSCQNAALRTVTGCIQMPCEEHLHDETKMLSVKEHNIILSKQFLLGCHRRDHPNHHLTELEPPEACQERSSYV
ncbi:uncharacterized protein LOC124419270 [Lucilia cuprina]|uniref:uncharacterized protein LOC124419270 n=1 Tax=Lucilia cuprina TaxID=7375 RepID=UPI001F053E39|nr:uncharacterized protein LOC124419270 [Lucilia cuprina]